jgi:hypothetical protein
MTIACSRQTLNAAFKRFQLLPQLPSPRSESGPPVSLKDNSGIPTPARESCVVRKGRSVPETQRELSRLIGPEHQQ